VAITPPPISPATYRSPIVTPGAVFSLPKIAPSSTSMMAGMARMNTTDWRSRKNDFTSTRPRASPTRHTPGSGACGARDAFSVRPKDRGRRNHGMRCGVYKTRR
jgi:hypothetical protein